MTVGTLGSKLELKIMAYCSVIESIIVLASSSCCKPSSIRYLYSFITSAQSTSRFSLTSTGSAIGSVGGGRVSLGGGRGSVGVGAIGSVSGKSELLDGTQSSTSESLH